MNLVAFFYLLSIIPALFMVISDLRKRNVNACCLAVFGAAVAAASIAGAGLAASLLNIAINLAAAAFILGCGILYWRLRYGKFENPTDKTIGLGDMVFVACISPLFDLRSFILILLASMILSLLFWGIVRLNRGESTTVPLAGCMGVVMIMWFVKEIAAV